MTGSEDEIARNSKQHLVAKERADLPLDDEAVLVLAAVPMERRTQRADIGCSTRENPPPDAAPSIMKRTPMLPRNPALPSPLRNTRAA